MLVLSTGYALYGVDHSGITWSQEMQTRPGASADPTIESQEMVLFDGVAVSSNQQFVAYVDHGAEIVVRSIRDGAEVGRVSYHAEGGTQLRCLSSDGDFVALASVPPDLPEGTTGDRLPWRVTIVDMRSGQATTEQPLEDLVKERTADDPEIQFTLYSLDWLPGTKLLVHYAGWKSETYRYDPVTGAMESIPGMDWVISVSDGGTVHGSGTVNGSATEPQGVEPLVWDGTTTQTLELAPAPAYALGGAFNSLGDALAIEVMSPRHEPRGWQVFRLNQGRWEPSGPLAENSWMKAAPRALSDDGAVAFAALEGGLLWESGQHTALLSYDFRTGVWQEWLGPEDLLVDFGEYPFVAIIPNGG